MPPNDTPHNNDDDDDDITQLLSQLDDTHPDAADSIRLAVPGAVTDDAADAAAADELHAAADSLDPHHPTVTPRG